MTKTTDDAAVSYSADESVQMSDLILRSSGVLSPDATLPQAQALIEDVRGLLYQLVRRGPTLTADQVAAVLAPWDADSHVDLMGTLENYHLAQPQAGAESYPPMPSPQRLDILARELDLLAGVQDDKYPNFKAIVVDAAAAIRLCATAALRARGAVPSDAEPDLVWRGDDPEEGGFLPYKMAERISDDLAEVDSATVVNVTCAKTLPNRKMRVWLEEDDEGNRVTHWEWVGSSTPAAPMNAQPAANEYAPLPEPAWHHSGHPVVLAEEAYTAAQLRAYADLHRGGGDGWTSVEEKFPPACHHLIVFGRKYGSKFPGKQVYVTYMGTRPRETVEDEEITHYMHLPEPPAPPAAAGKAMP